MLMSYALTPTIWAWHGCAGAKYLGHAPIPVSGRQQKPILVSAIVKRAYAAEDADPFAAYRYGPR